MRLLIEVGASQQDVWISGKPPSEEVIDLLLSDGMSPDDEPEPQLDDTDDSPLSLGTGVMDDIARHLESAYRDSDLDLLGSLLHPQVRWTGLCHNRAQVLDWYRGLVADGTIAAVETSRSTATPSCSVSAWPAKPKGHDRHHHNTSTKYSRSRTPK